ncbi:MULTISPECIES: histidine kinase [Olivibacter]|uniref:Histidine kinase n=1 Tax=Olivibacter jilunii TaxID=985016 RepID=A0ABW6B2H4_9SPHI
MMLRLLDQTGYKRFLLYFIPIFLYCFASYWLNRLMMPTITLWSVLGFEIVFIAICAGFAFIVNLALSPRWWYVGCLLLVLFSFVASVMAYHYIYGVMPFLGMSITKAEVDFNQREFVQNCILGLFRAFTYGVLYVVLRRLKEESKQRIEELKQRLEAEQLARRLEQERNDHLMSLLTAEMYPHFIKNALNMLAGMALRHHDDRMLESVLDLESLLDYSNERIRDLNQLVNVNKELKRVQRLIRLIRRQLGKDAAVLYVRKGMEMAYLIPPFVLITIVENAMKYGEISETSPLRINVAYLEGSFLFTCYNRKKKGSRTVSSSKIGLNNITRRLNMLLRDRFELHIQDEADDYTVSLKLT